MTRGAKRASESSSPVPGGADGRSTRGMSQVRKASPERKRFRTGSKTAERISEAGGADEASLGIAREETSNKVSEEVVRNVEFEGGSDARAEVSESKQEVSDVRQEASDIRQAAQEHTRAAESARAKDQELGVVALGADEGVETIAGQEGSEGNLPQFEGNAEADAPQKMPLNDGFEVLPMEVDKTPSELVSSKLDTEDATSGGKHSVAGRGGATIAELEQEMELLQAVQPPPIVRRIAVRSVLWDDILVDVPSNATMAEFRKAIEFQSEGRLREDMMPELVYDGILLPADETSIEEAGLTAGNAVVGFLALDVLTFLGSAGLETEPAREKKPRDRRIKIYVPCAPRTPFEPFAFDDSTPMRETITITPAIPATSGPSSGPAQPLNRPPLKEDMPIPLIRDPEPSSLETQTVSNLQGQTNSTTSQHLTQPISAPDPPGVVQIPPNPLPEPPKNLQTALNPPREKQSLPLPSQPPLSKEPSGHIPQVDLHPSESVGPSKLSPGMVDASSQIEPGELHYPLLVLAAVPPHLLQYSMGGNPLPPQGVEAAAGGPGLQAVEPPQSEAPAAEAVVEQPPSSSEGMDMALVPVPYLPPPAPIYGPGGREMVPVDTGRRRRKHRTPEDIAEEERQVRLRRARKLFTVGEVEALVTAVERLGPGRWREVKERVFSHADHRTYGDLKDKWKTLVKTAQIAPQQRRAVVPIPEEILERVTRAHAFWMAQAAKDERLSDGDGGPHVHYIRVPEAVRRPVFFENGRLLPQHKPHTHYPPSEGGGLPDGQHTHELEGGGRVPNPGEDASGGPNQSNYGPQDPHLQHAELNQRTDPGEAHAQDAQDSGVHPNSRHSDSAHEQYARQDPHFSDASAVHAWQQQMHAQYYQQQQEPGYSQEYAYKTGQHSEESLALESGQQQGAPYAHQSGHDRDAQVQEVSHYTKVVGPQQEGDLQQEEGGYEEYQQAGEGGNQQELAAAHDGYVMRQESGYLLGSQTRDEGVNPEGGRAAEGGGIAQTSGLEGGPIEPANM